MVDGLLYPFRDFPPIVGLTLVSLLTAIGLLIVFKHTSNQKALEAVKRKIHAGLFEIRLYNDDFRSIMRAQLEKPAPRLQDLAAAIVAEFGIDTPINPGRPGVDKEPTDN